MYGPVRTVVWQGSAGDRRPTANRQDLPVASEGLKREVAVRRPSPQCQISLGRNPQRRPLGVG